MSITITLAGQKGGTGKSTIAVHLASEYHRRGHRVLVLDADPQGTALTWSEAAAERGHPAPNVLGIGDALRSQLPSLRRGYDLVFIDTAGRQSKRLAGALALSDLALVPCKPSAPDVWALGDTIELVERVREVRDLEARIVVNEVNHTALAEAAGEAIEAAELDAMTSTLGRRVAFAESMAEGRGVTLHAPGSVAALELSNLADEIDIMLGIEAANAA
jgi:chromosome partitioning protein